MRSIRLSLTVYFLALLAVALGAVSLLAYNRTRQTLEGKERAAEQLVEARFQDDCAKERQKLDDALLQPTRDPLNWEPGADVLLGPGRTVRRVALTAPAVRMPGRPNGRGPGRRGGPPQPESWARPALYIQYASDTGKRDAALAALA